MRKERTAVYYVKTSGEIRSTGSKKRCREKELGEKLLAYALKDYGGFAVSPKEIARTKKGKPYLRFRHDIHYNLSHSGEYVVCAVSFQPVGVDIEKHRFVPLEKLAQKTLSVKEWEALHRAGDPLKQYFDLWVLKESYLKWTGEGITRDLRTLPLRGTGQLFFLDEGYSAALWMEEECKTEYVPVRYKALSGD